MSGKKYYCDVSFYLRYDECVCILRITSRDLFRTVERISGHVTRNASTKREKKGKKEK